jgi:hypothetical protein
MNENNTQLTLSYELLFLLQWLIEHEPNKLKNLIADALKSGLKEELKTIDKSIEQKNTQDMQYSLVDFLGFMEIMLQEVNNEQTMQRIMEKKLMPALDHIDSTECDNETVQCSVEEATSKLELEPDKNAQELLFQELLRCWKPNKETLSN